jgi:hypothetical protein
MECKIKKLFFLISVPITETSIFAPSFLLAFLAESLKFLVHPSAFARFFKSITTVRLDSRKLSEAYHIY